MSEMKPVPTFETRVDQFVRLRDKIKEMEDEHKEKMKPFIEARDRLNNMLLDMLQQSGQEAAKTAHGTCYKKTRKSATIADGDAFRRHIIGNEDWDLADWRANPVKVAEFIDENHEPPPGVNYTLVTDVGVRRS